MSRKRGKKRWKEVFHLRHWQRFLPDKKYLQATAPLPYIRIPLNSHRTSEGEHLTRDRIAYERRWLHDQGGAELREIYYALAEYTAGRSYLQGYLLTPVDTPATPEDLAEALGLKTDQIAWALRTLQKKPLKLIEKVGWQQVRTELKAG
jgi:hypothetical protein